MGWGIFINRSMLLCFSLLLSTECRSELWFKGLLKYPSHISRLDRYPQEVAIYGNKKSKSGYDLILHLHGFRMKRDHLNGRLENFNDVLEEFQFNSLLQESHRNALLVIPSSLGKCETYATHLIPEKRFQLFFNSLISTIGAYPKRILLVGHSGAYDALASILRSPFHSLISELYLLDATYGEEETFADFANERGHRLVSVFRKDTSTEDGSFSIWSRLHLERQADPEREAFYQSLLPESVAAERIPRFGGSFIASTSDHWQIVNEYWARLLKTTELRPTHE